MFFNYYNGHIEVSIELENGTLELGHHPDGYVGLLFSPYSEDEVSWAVSVSVGEFWSLLRLVLPPRIQEKISLVSGNFYFADQEQIYLVLEAIQDKLEVWAPGDDETTDTDTDTDTTMEEEWLNEELTLGNLTLGSC